MMPSAKMVKRDSAPPENRLNTPRIPPCWDWNNSASPCGSIPGTGMCAPIRYTINAPMRNINRRLRSPNFPALPSVAAGFATAYALFLLGRHGTAGSFDRRLGTRSRTHAAQDHLAAYGTRNDDLGRQSIGGDDARLLERQQIDLVYRELVQFGQA